MSEIKPISTPSIAIPGGHYSQSIVHNGLIYVSGLLPIHPDQSKENGGIAIQTKLVLSNLNALLLASGSRLDRTLKCTVYIANVDLWTSVNEIYAEFFGEHKPARAVVPVNGLHYGFLIELDAIAALCE